MSIGIGLPQRRHSECQRETLKPARLRCRTEANAVWAQKPTGSREVPQFRWRHSLTFHCKTAEGQ